MLRVKLGALQYGGLNGNLKGEEGSNADIPLYSILPVNNQLDAGPYASRADDGSAEQRG